MISVYVRSHGSRLQRQVAEMVDPPGRPGQVVDESDDDEYSYESEPEPASDAPAGVRLAEAPTPAPAESGGGGGGKTRPPEPAESEPESARPSPEPPAGGRASHADKRAPAGSRRPRSPSRRRRGPGRRDKSPSRGLARRNTGHRASCAASAEPSHRRPRTPPRRRASDDGAADAEKSAAWCEVCHRTLKSSSQSTLDQHRRCAWHQAWALYAQNPTWDWGKCKKEGQRESDRLWNEEYGGSKGKADTQHKARGKTKDKKKNKRALSPVLDREEDPRDKKPPPPGPTGGGDSDDKVRVLAALWERTVQQLTS